MIWRGSGETEQRTTASRDWLIGYGQSGVVIPFGIMPQWNLIYVKSLTAGWV
jgi:hypothetical protein